MNVNTCIIHHYVASYILPRIWRNVNIHRSSVFYMFMYVAWNILSSNSKNVCYIASQFMCEWVSEWCDDTINPCRFFMLPTYFTSALRFCNLAPWKSARQFSSVGEAKTPIWTALSQSFTGPNASPIQTHTSNIRTSTVHSFQILQGHHWLPVSPLLYPVCYWFILCFVRTFNHGALSDLSL